MLRRTVWRTAMVDEASIATTLCRVDDGILIDAKQTQLPPIPLFRVPPAYRDAGALSPQRTR